MVALVFIFLRTFHFIAVYLTALLQFWVPCFKLNGMDLPFKFSFKIGLTIFDGIKCKWCFHLHVAPFDATGDWRKKEKLWLFPAIIKVKERKKEHRIYAFMRLIFSAVHFINNSMWWPSMAVNKLILFIHI